METAKKLKDIGSIERHRLEQIPITWLLLGPSLLIIGALIAGPLVYSLWMSVTNFNLLRGSGTFVGLQNYVHLLQNQGYRMAFVRTIGLMFAAVNVELIFGIVLAALLNRQFRGRRVVQTLLLLPMLLSPVLVGFQLKWIVHPQMGVVTQLFHDLGLPWLAMDYLSSPQLALPTIAVFDIWMNTSFMMLLMIAGMRSVPDTPIEAARMAGASKFEQFRDITLPLLKPYILVALVIRSADIANRIFPIVWMTTRGGPGGASEIIPTWVYKTAFKEFQFGLGAAAGYLGFVLSIVFVTILYLQLRSEREVNQI